MIDIFACISMIVGEGVRVAGRLLGLGLGKGGRKRRVEV